jgi:hypothetical protein
MKLAEFWLSIMEDPMRRDSDRLRSSELLADRGWGKAAVFAPQEGDPFDLEEVEAAAEEFRRRVIRLAERKREST